MLDSLLTTLKEAFGRDERFLIHRLKASRLALFVGVLALGALFWHDYLLYARTRIDLLAILIIMAFSKVGATVYYRVTN
jgi:hypothetical protein